MLGADDAAGLVEILGGIRRVLASGKPHRDIEVLFPIAEEVYTKGSRVFDFSRIRAKEAYVLDLSGPVERRQCRLRPYSLLCLRSMEKQRTQALNRKKGFMQ